MSDIQPSLIPECVCTTLAECRCVDDAYDPSIEEEIDAYLEKLHNSSEVVYFNRHWQNMTDTAINAYLLRLKAINEVVYFTGATG